MFPLLAFYCYLNYLCWNTLVMLVLVTGDLLLQMRWRERRQKRNIQHSVAVRGLRSLTVCCSSLIVFVEKPMVKTESSVRTSVRGYSVLPGFETVCKQNCVHAQYRHETISTESSFFFSWSLTLFRPGVAGL